MPLEYIQKAILNELQDEKCISMHNGSCNQKAISQLIMGCKSVYQMYLLVHLVPFLLFKIKKALKE